jgi:hypothetical protein
MWNASPEPHRRHARVYATTFEHHKYAKAMRLIGEMAVSGSDVATAIRVSGWGEVIDGIHRGGPTSHHGWLDVELGPIEKWVPALLKAPIVIEPWVEWVCQRCISDELGAFMRKHSGGFAFAVRLGLDQKR